MSDALTNLMDRLLDGDRRALARMITLVESRAVDIATVMAKIYPHTGKGTILGFTGPPGAGKSTMVDKVTAAYRAQGKTVGIVAIDPSSPFSGGALLGDRIRMHRHFADTGVFIRSLSTRGSFGGLSRATRDVIRLMDAAGVDIVIVETVGVGQTELDIMEVAHTTTVILVPESGDVVQTMKAGLTEIADVFVVNKGDRAGADAIMRELTQMIELNPPSGWKIPVLKTQAVKNIGVEELVEKIDAHTAYYKETGEQKRIIKMTPEKEMIELLAVRMEDGYLREKASDGALAELCGKIASGETNPYEGAKAIAENPAWLTALFRIEN